jgi:hypothetical protein
VWEPLDHELLPEESFDELQLFRRDGDVQVEADYGLHVGIDCLTPHQAVTDSVGLESSDQPFEEVGAILHDGLPEHLRLHDSPRLNLGLPESEDSIRSRACRSGS